MQRRSPPSLLPRTTPRFTARASCSTASIPRQAISPALMAPRPVVLCILDGWGHASAGACNAVTLAKAPTWHRWMAEAPHGLIDASELAVGLPAGQMGNSEVGHMNIGAGRVVMQDLPRIEAAIDSGELARNPRLLDYIARLKASGGRCHLLGLLSPGGVHSHQH